MRYVRVGLDGRQVYGELRGSEVWLLSAAPWEPHCQATGERRALNEVELLVPSEPTKIVCVGLNYRKHAAEMNKQVNAEPVIFIKPPSALNAHGKPIVVPSVSEDVQHEAELALVIGRRLRRADEATAAKGIFGLTCFNDVTARDIQRREVQHTRAKGFDTFACAGPWMVPASELSTDDLRVQCRVNGVTRQDGRTSAMQFSPARLVSFISQGMTLEPGDLVVTGTPEGVSRIHAGDVVEIDIDGIGVLSNPVLSELE